MQGETASWHLFLFSFHTHHVHASYSVWHFSQEHKNEQYSGVVQVSQTISAAYTTFTACNTGSSNSNFIIGFCSGADYCAGRGKYAGATS